MKLTRYDEMAPRHVAFAGCVFCRRRGPGFDTNCTIDGDGDAYVCDACIRLFAKTLGYRTDEETLRRMQQLEEAVVALDDLNHATREQRDDARAKLDVLRSVAEEFRLEDASV